MYDPKVGDTCRLWKRCVAKFLETFFFQFSASAYGIWFFWTAILYNSPFCCYSSSLRTERGVCYSLLAGNIAQGRRTPFEMIFPVKTTVYKVCYSVYLFLAEDNRGLWLITTVLWQLSIYFSVIIYQLHHAVFWEKRKFLMVFVLAYSCLC